jgi:hypothetical protein
METRYKFILFFVIMISIVIAFAVLNATWFAYYLLALIIFFTGLMIRQVYKLRGE